MLLCVHVRSFKLAVARRDRPDIPPDAPVLLADKFDRGRVLEINEIAHELGARAGQTVLQARAAAGGAHVLVHDPARSHAVWIDMLDALDAVSPLVDDSGEGTAYADMRGIGGDVQEWTRRILRLLGDFGLPVRAAPGANKFLARAATYEAQFETLPIEVLEIDPRFVERLHLLGVRTLSELARLPHGPFVRRFGKAAAFWHDCARGIDPTPFRPRAHELQIDAAVYGEGSAALAEQIYFALRVLAERVCGDLARAGKAASQVRMTFECENGDVREIETGFAQATGDARTMLDVMRAKLEGTAFEAPVSGLKLQALRFEECGMPAALFGQGADAQAVAVAMARLQSVDGVHVHRARVRPAHRLEKRFEYDPFALVTRRHAEPRAHRNPVPQLRLLNVREIAVTMRGNAPASVGARAVLDCAGPWRVDDGWFDEPLTRDEYDVLLEDGMLCRIYRQGERWYLRGAYD